MRKICSDNRDHLCSHSRHCTVGRARTGRADMANECGHCYLHVVVREYFFVSIDPLDQTASRVAKRGSVAGYRICKYQSAGIMAWKAPTRGGNYSLRSPSFQQNRRPSQHQLDGKVRPLTAEWG